MVLQWGWFTDNGRVEISSQPICSSRCVCLFTYLCLCVSLCLCLRRHSQTADLYVKRTKSVVSHDVCVCVCLCVCVCMCIKWCHMQSWTKQKSMFFKTSPFRVAHLKSSDVPYIIVPNTPTQILKDLHKKVLLATKGASCSVPKRPTIRCLRKRPTTLLLHYKRDL